MHGFIVHKTKDIIGLSIYLHMTADRRCFTTFLGRYIGCLIISVDPSVLLEILEEMKANNEFEEVSSFDDYTFCSCII